MARPKKVGEVEETKDVEVVETKAEKPAKENPKFDFIVATRADNAPLITFNHNGTLFYGDKDEADSMLAYAKANGYPDAEVIKVG